MPGDAADIALLVGAFVDEGLLLPRSVEEIQHAIGDYVVAVDGHDRILACAALVEYSPSLAEVGSVAVAREAQGHGLGSLVVRSIEEMARRREVPEVFAMSHAVRFFEGLGYSRASVSEFPEKLARYDALMERGVSISPKPCFRKVLA